MDAQLAHFEAMDEPSLSGCTNFPALFQEEAKQILPLLENVAWDERFLYFWLLREVLGYSGKEAITKTLELQIDYKELYDFITTGLWFKKEREPGDLEQEALLSIAREFSKIEKVRSIYVQTYREELQVYILLTITQYDSELTDTLLDIEYDIRKRYQEIVFEFFYPPVGMSDKKDFIHPQAQCIYAR